MAPLWDVFSRLARSAAATDDPAKMTTNSTVQAVNDIRDIKPPMELPVGRVWLWVALGAAAAGIILYWLWKRRRKVTQARPAAPPVPAHLRAREKLDQALAMLSQPKPFCVLVSDTVRFYLEDRFELRAPERTTEEFLRELSGSALLSPEKKASLANFLAGCDLVKFAKYEPGEAELRAFHHSALRLVEETSPGAGPAGSDSKTSAPN